MANYNILSMFLYCFLESAVTIVDDNIKNDHQNVGDVEPKRQIKGPCHYFGYDSADISCKDQIVKQDALSFCGA